MPWRLRLAFLGAAFVSFSPVLRTVSDNANSWFVLASRHGEQMFLLLSFYLQILP